MAKSWRKRATRRVLGWLGRIEGVEKPALLVGFGLLLYRVWRGSKLDRAAEDAGQRPDQPRIVARVRRRLSQAMEHQDPPAPGTGSMSVKPSEDDSLGA